MGNRAIVTFEDTPDNHISVYLHNEGGLGSVQAFYDTALERFGIVDAISFSSVAADYFGYRGFTVYLVTFEEGQADNTDNGIYTTLHRNGIASRSWGTIRPYADMCEYDQNRYDAIRDALSPKTEMAATLVDVTRERDALLKQQAAGFDDLPSMVATLVEQTKG